MLLKIISVLFYLMIALWAFGVGFPYLMLILGICALVLAIVAGM